MPKINGKPIDPKAYAKRLTEAKKTLARTSPEVKRKIAEMYPKITSKDIVKKALSPKAIKKGPLPSGPRRPRATARPAPAGPKKKSPGVMITPKPKAKKPKLDDFLLKGKRPPIAPGQKKLPSDSDVILKNYNKKK